MKKISHAALILLSTAAVVLAADVPPFLHSTDKEALAAAEGKSVAVEGKVTAAEWSKSGKILNIEFDNDTTFIAGAFEANRKKLDAAFNDDFAKTLKGATVRLTGRLSKYGGRDPKFANAYQLLISMSHQVTILPPATQPTPIPAS